MAAYARKLAAPVQNVEPCRFNLPNPAQNNSEATHSRRGLTAFRSTRNWSHLFCFESESSLSSCLIEQHRSGRRDIERLDSFDHRYVNELVRLFGRSG